MMTIRTIFLAMGVCGLVACAPSEFDVTSVDGQGLVDSNFADDNGDFQGDGMNGSDGTSTAQNNNGANRAANGNAFDQYDIVNTGVANTGLLNNYPVFQTVMVVPSALGNRVRFAQESFLYGNVQYWFRPELSTMNGSRFNTIYVDQVTGYQIVITGSYTNQRVQSVVSYFDGFQMTPVLPSVVYVQ